MRGARAWAGWGQGLAGGAMQTDQGIPRRPARPLRIGRLCPTLVLTARLPPRSPHPAGFWAPQPGRGCYIWEGLPPDQQYSRIPEEGDAVKFVAWGDEGRQLSRE